MIDEDFSFIIYSMKFYGKLLEMYFSLNKCYFNLCRKFKRENIKWHGKRRGLKKTITHDDIMTFLLRRRDAWVKEKLSD